MGYAYDNRGRTVCDSCGTTGGVRKRTCIHKVITETGRPIPYCPPPALCSACYAKHGKAATIHAGCKAGAEASTRHYAALRDGLAAGRYKVRSAFGSGMTYMAGRVTVPAGKVGVLARDKDGAERWALVPKDEYGSTGTEHNWLDDFSTEPWPLA